MGNTNNGQIERARSKKLMTPDELSAYCRMPKQRVYSLTH